MIDNVFTSATFNSYFLDIAELDLFVSALDGLWNLTDWNLLTDLQKENVMHGATGDLNTFSFTGIIDTGIISPYNMKFPRNSITYENGVPIASGETPLFVKEYVSERSIERLANQKTGKFYDGRIKKQKLGKLEQEFQNPRDSRILVNSLRKASSFGNIVPYVVGLSGGFSYVQRA